MLTADDSADVSIIIRNRNEGKFLRRVLEAISAQDLKPVDVVLVDNESEDDSIEIAKQFGAKIVSLAKSSFTYGRALNIGMQEAAGDICVFLSAHSLPLGPNFLRECVKPFSIPEVAAVRCLHTGKKRDLQNWVKPEILRSRTAVEEVISKGPLANGCAVRKKVWSEIPFDEEVIAAEEKLWALAALRKGYLIYSPCPAMYLYMKELSPFECLVRSKREVAAVYERTGIKLGFARTSMSGALVELLKAVLYVAPRAAIVVAARAAMLCYFRVVVSFSRRADVGAEGPTVKPSASSQSTGIP